MNKLDEFINDLNGINVWAENFINRWKDDNLLEQGIKKEDIINKTEFVFTKFAKLAKSGDDLWFSFMPDDDTYDS